MAVTVVEEEWSAGKVDHQNTYADEVDELEDDTADNIEDQYDDDFEEVRHLLHMFFITAVDEY